MQSSAKKENDELRNYTKINGVRTNDGYVYFNHLRKKVPVEEYERIYKKYMNMTKKRNKESYSKKAGRRRRKGRNKVDVITE